MYFYKQKWQIILLDTEFMQITQNLAVALLEKKTSASFLKWVQQIKYWYLYSNLTISKNNVKVSYNFPTRFFPQNCSANSILEQK